MISLGSHRCPFLFTRLRSLVDAASLPLVHIYYLCRIDTLWSSLPGYFFCNSCWQILKDITRLMIMIQVKLLTLFHFVVGAFVSISFRELILTS